MKKRNVYIKIIFVILLFTICQFTFADSDDSSYNSDSYINKLSVTIYPLSDVGYALTKLSSDSGNIFSKMYYFSAEIEYSAFKYISFSSEFKAAYNVYDNQTFFIVGPGVRLYSRGNGMNGFFIAHNIEFWANDYRENDGYLYNGIPYEYISTSWLGYKACFNNIIIETSLGIYNQFNISRKNEPVISGNTINIFPIIGFGVGYIF